MTIDPPTNDDDDHEWMRQNAINEIGDAIAALEKARDLVHASNDDVVEEVEQQTGMVLHIAEKLFETLMRGVAGSGSLWAT